jgi:hypothetical protein
LEFKKKWVKSYHYLPHLGATLTEALVIRRRNPRLGARAIDGVRLAPQFI